MNYSILRYPGGKTRAVKTLLNYIPEGTESLISPFFGGGSFEFALHQKGIKIKGYDIYQPLVSFWRALKYAKEPLYQEVIKYYPLNKEQFYELQKACPLENDWIKQGAIFYVLNRSSFSGSTMSGGMSPNHPRFTISSLERLKNFRMGIEVQQQSFESVLTNNKGLAYCDPPYLISSNLYGTKGNTHKSFNHVLLSEILNKRGDFILSYNDCPEIRDLYKEHCFYTPEWSYGMGSNKKSKEVLIITKDIEKRLK